MKPLALTSTKALEILNTWHELLEHKIGALQSHENESGTQYMNEAQLAAWRKQPATIERRREIDRTRRAWMLVENVRDNLKAAHHQHQTLTRQQNEQRSFQEDLDEDPMLVPLLDLVGLAQLLDAFGITVEVL